MMMTSFVPIFGGDGGGFFHVVMEAEEKLEQDLSLLSYEGL